MYQIPPYMIFISSSGKGKCLGNTPPEQDFEFPKELPGVRHDADEQCQLQFGESSSACGEEEVSKECTINKKDVDVGLNDLTSYPEKHWK